MNVFDLFARLSLDTSQYESGLDKAAGYGIRGAKIIGAAIAGATTAVVGLGASSVRTGMNFDTSMSQVVATMGYTVDELQDGTSEASRTMEQLRDFAQEMGSTTVFSASQAADALNYMALAGYDAETSMSMLPNVLNLAAAGSIDLARASDMVTDAQSALGLTLPETESLVDQMARTASKSNTSVEQLGDAILTIGATAQNVRGGTTELNTLLGVLADNGIKGAEGGTHLRNIILSLTNPTSEATKTLEGLGVSIYDSEGNMRSMIDVITEMQSAMSDMDGQSRDAAVGGIFNRADMAAVNALLSTDVERFGELSGAIEDSAGAAQDMADVQLDNLSGDITLFKSALEGAQIAVSDQLTPTLREFVQLGSEGLSDVTAAFKEGGLEGAFAAIGEWLSDAVNMIVEYIPDIVSAGVTLLEAFINGIVDNADSIIKAVEEVIKVLADKLLAPDKIEKLLKAGAEILVTIVNGIAENAEAMTTTIISVITTIVSILMSPEVREPLLEGGLMIIQGLALGLAESTPELIALIPEIIADTIVIIEDLFPVLIETVVQLLGALGVAVFGVVLGLMGQSFDGVKDGIEAIMSSFKDFGKNLLGLLSSTFEAAVEWVASGVEGWVTFFSDGFDNIKEKVSSVLNTISETFSSIFDTVKETVSGAIDYVKGLFDFEWSLPDLKLPHFSITGSLDLMANPPSVPKLSVDWYAKAMNQPYMLDEAAIFGMSNGRLLGGGEKGDEMIYGRSSLMQDIKEAVSGASAQTIIIPVYIGDEKIDELVVKSNQRNNYISGGR